TSARRVVTYARRRWCLVGRRLTAEWSAATPSRLLRTLAQAMCARAISLVRRRKDYRQTPPDRYRPPGLVFDRQHESGRGNPPARASTDHRRRRGDRSG